MSEGNVALRTAPRTHERIGRVERVPVSEGAYS